MKNAKSVSLSVPKKCYEIALCSHSHTVSAGVCSSRASTAQATTGCAPAKAPSGSSERDTPRPRVPSSSTGSASRDVTSRALRELSTKPEIAAAPIKSARDCES